HVEEDEVGAVDLQQAEEPQTARRLRHVVAELLQHLLKPVAQRAIVIDDHDLFATCLHSGPHLRTAAPARHSRPSTARRRAARRRPGFATPAAPAARLPRTPAATAPATGCRLPA